MALTRCPDCGHELSTAAPMCPNCGRPQVPLETLDDSAHRVGGWEIAGLGCLEFSGLGCLVAIAIGAVILFKVFMFFFGWGPIE